MRWVKIGFIYFLMFKFLILSNQINIKQIMKPAHYKPRGQVNYWKGQNLSLKLIKSMLRNFQDNLLCKLSLPDRKQFFPMGEDKLFVYEDKSAEQPAGRVLGRPVFGGGQFIKYVIFIIIKSGRDEQEAHFLLPSFAAGLQIKTTNSANGFSQVNFRRQQFSYTSITDSLISFSVVLAPPVLEPGPQVGSLLVVEESPAQVDCAQYQHHCPHITSALILDDQALEIGHHGQPVLEDEMRLQEHLAVHGQPDGAQRHQRRPHPDARLDLPGAHVQPPEVPRPAGVADDERADSPEVGEHQHLQLLGDGQPSLLVVPLENLQHGGVVGVVVVAEGDCLAGAPQQEAGVDGDLSAAQDVAQPDHVLLLVGE